MTAKPDSGQDADLDTTLRDSLVPALLSVRRGMHGAVPVGVLGQLFQLGLLDMAGRLTAEGEKVVAAHNRRLAAPEGAVPLSDPRVSPAGALYYGGPPGRAKPEPRASGDVSSAVASVKGPLDAVELIADIGHRLGAKPSQWPPRERRAALMAVGAATAADKDAAVANARAEERRQDRKWRQARRRLGERATKLLTAYGTAKQDDAQLAAEALDYYARFVRDVLAAVGEDGADEDRT